MAESIIKSKSLGTITLTDGSNTVPNLDKASFIVFIMKASINDTWYSTIFTKEVIQTGERVEYYVTNSFYGNIQRTASNTLYVSATGALVMKVTLIA